MEKLAFGIQCIVLTQEHELQKKSKTLQLLIILLLSIMIMMTTKDNTKHNKETKIITYCFA